MLHARRGREAEATLRIGAHGERDLRDRDAGTRDRAAIRVDDTATEQRPIPVVLRHRGRRRFRFRCRRRGGGDRRGVAARRRHGLGSMHDWRSLLDDRGLRFDDRRDPSDPGARIRTGRGLCAGLLDTRQNLFDRQACRGIAHLRSAYARRLGRGVVGTESELGPCRSAVTIRVRSRGGKELQHEQHEDETGDTHERHHPCAVRPR